MFCCGSCILQTFSYKNTFIILVVDITIETFHGMLSHSLMLVYFCHIRNARTCAFFSKKQQDSTVSSWRIIILPMCTRNVISNIVLNIFTAYSEWSFVPHLECKCHSHNTADCSIANYLKVLFDTFQRQGLLLPRCRILNTKLCLRSRLGSKKDT